MKLPFSPEIKHLARIFPVPLYSVGGFVRNYLISGKISEDVDLAAPLKSGDAAHYISLAGFKTVAEYSKTGTVVFSFGKQKYEYTSFRIDSYPVGDGVHTPTEVEFTKDIEKDARRRQILQ